MNLKRTWTSTVKPFLKRWAGGITIILSTCLFILRPLGGAHIRIEGNEINFDSEYFNSADITFVNPVKINQYTIESKGETNKAYTTGSTAITNIVVGQVTKTLIITNPLEKNAKNNSSYTTHIYAEQNTGFDVSEVKFDGKIEDLKIFIIK